MKNSHFNILLVLLLLITTVLFFFGGPDYYSTRFHQKTWNLGHVFYYTVWAYVLLRKWNWLSRRSFVFQMIGLLGFTLVTGILIEFIQVDFNRLKEVGDLWRDIVGTLLGLILFSKSSSALPKNIQKLMWTGIVILVGVEFLAPARALTDEIIAERQFPLLSGFETPFEIDRWAADGELHRTSQQAFTGKYSARVLLTTKLYSGISLNFFHRNWEEYRSLNLAIFNTQDTVLQMTCRIHDHKHILNGQAFIDRFNRRLLLVPGWNTVEISLVEVREAPSGREMDLKQIYNLGVFATRLKVPVVIYLDDVRLIR